jgi:thymidylate synthase (FAD)
MTIIDRELTCLDHGFVRVVDTMGTDEAIVQAAQVSYGRGTKKGSDTRGLIRYLMRHWHSTPFEMCEIKLHVKLPVFVARQWIRHRTANVNEYSARYSILDREFYIPNTDAIQPQSTTNKQGRAGELPEDVRLAMRETIRQQSEGAYQVYEELRTGWPWLDAAGQPYDPEHDEPAPYEDEDAGVENGMSRELARINLPLNIYTQWYWKVDLHNLFHLLRLRADPHAQMEIRVYAEAICKLVKEWCPIAYEAFEDYRLHAISLSRQEVELMKLLTCRNPAAFRALVDEEDRGLSDREKRELIEKFLPRE